MPASASPFLDERSSSGRSKHASIAGYLCIGGAALFYGISANLGRAAFVGRIHLFGAAMVPIPPLMLAQSRSTFAALALFPILLFFRGSRRLRVQPRDLRDCVILGTLGLAACNYFYYLAIQRTGVVTAIILQYLAPVFVLLWMLLRKLQSPTLFRVGGVLIAVVGSVLAIGAVSRTHGFPWLAIARGQLRFDLIGVVAALIAAVTFAFYNIFGRHLVLCHDRWTVIAWALGGATVGWLFVNPPWSIVAAHYSSRQWAFMLLFSVTSVLIPISLYFAGLHYLDATRAIVTSCLEPVFSILIAAVALGEVVGGIQCVGILLVLASTILVQLDETGTVAQNQPPLESME